MKFLKEQKRVLFAIRERRGLLARERGNLMLETGGLSLDMSTSTTQSKADDDSRAGPRG